MRPPPEPIEWELDAIRDGGVGGDGTALLWGPLFVLLVVVAMTVICHA